MTERRDDAAVLERGATDRTDSSSIACCFPPFSLSLSLSLFPAAAADIAKKSCPILFFANKSDLPKALTPAQISEALELNKLTDRPFNIV